MLYAHVNKFIDLTKPVHPLAEELILRHVEVMLELEFAKLYPVHDDDNIYYVHADWLNALKSCILHIEKTPKVDEFAQKVELWKKLNSKQ